MKFVRTLVMGLLVLAIVYSLVRPRGGPGEGMDAPRFRGTLLSGESIEPEMGKGAVLVLDFWATWCGPCRKSLPALNRIHQKYAQDQRTVVLSVNQDRGLNQKGLVTSYMSSQKLGFPVILDRGNIAAMYRVTTLPTLVVIGASGRVSKVTVGLTSGDIDVLVTDLEEAIADARAE